MFQTTWTYNQGVIASGLANLYATTGDASLLDEAEITLDATINHLAENFILKETCDDADAGGPVCNQDQVSSVILWIWTRKTDKLLIATLQGWCRCYDTYE
jgi:hypothetical protein